MAPPLDDEQLLNRFARGERNALGELARRYELPLLGLACGMLGGRRDLAMDAVQETWMRVIRFHSNFNGRSSVKTWLYRIAINQCRNVQAMQNRAGLSAIDDLEQLPIVEPSRASDLNESNSQLHEALAKLNEDKRTIVLLCYHAGMTHDLAAEILEIPLGTLKSRLHSALNELRASLASENFHEQRA